MAVLRLCRFGIEMPIPAYFWTVFWGFDSLNVVGYCQDPQKAHPNWPETRALCRRDRPDRSRNATWTRGEESNKEKKKRNLKI